MHGNPPTKKKMVIKSYNVLILKNNAMTIKIRRKVWQVKGCGPQNFIEGNLALSWGMVLEPFAAQRCIKRSAA